MTKRGWIVGGILGGVVAAGLTIWGVVARWDPELATGVAGLWVGLAGFAIAIAEIRRARTASEATEQAVRRTLVAVAAGRLAVTVTQLRQVVEQIDDASVQRDFDGGRRALNSWRALASDAHGLLRRRFGPEHPALAGVSRSIRTARQTKDRLYEEEDMRIPLRECAANLEEVADELAALLDQLMPTIYEEDEDA